MHNKKIFDFPDARRRDFNFAEGTVTIQLKPEEKPLTAAVCMFLLVMAQSHLEDWIKE